MGVGGPMRGAWGREEEQDCMGGGDDDDGVGGSVWRRRQATCCSFAEPCRRCRVPFGPLCEHAINVVCEARAAHVRVDGAAVPARCRISSVRRVRAAARRRRTIATCSQVPSLLLLLLLLVCTNDQQWHAGDNVGTGKDYTLFSTVDGVVVFQKKGDRDRVSVYPFDHPKAQAAATATHTTKAGEGGSRKERRRAMYKPRGGAGAAAAQQPVATVAVVAASTQP